MALDRNAADAELAQSLDHAGERRAPVFGISKRNLVSPRSLTMQIRVGLAGPVDASEQLTVADEPRRRRDTEPDAQCLAVQPAYP
jgi:hypothetical protein